MITSEAWLEAKSAGGARPRAPRSRRAGMTRLILIVRRPAGDRLVLHPRDRHSIVPRRRLASRFQARRWHERHLLAAADPPKLTYGRRNRLPRSPNSPLRQKQGNGTGPLGSPGNPIPVEPSGMQVMHPPGHLAPGTHRAQRVLRAKQRGAYSHAGRAPRRIAQARPGPGGTGDGGDFASVREGEARARDEAPRERRR
jgi:hypothetical protein